MTPTQAKPAASTWPAWTDEVRFVPAMDAGLLAALSAIREMATAGTPTTDLALFDLLERIEAAARTAMMEHLSQGEDNLDDAPF